MGGAVDEAALLQKLLELGKKEGMRFGSRGR